MTPDAIAHAIEIYKYWVLIPLALVEGPVVAFVAGALSAIGYLNLYIALVILFLRDILVDAACYFLGRYAKDRNSMKWLLKKIKVSEDHLQGVKKLWDEHGFRTMLISKLSYGVAALFLVVAGMVDMPFWEFMRYASLIAVIQYGTLFFIGFFFGNAFGSLAGIINNIQYVIAGVSLFVLLYYVFRGYLRKRLSKGKRSSMI